MYSAYMVHETQLEVPRADPVQVYTSHQHGEATTLLYNVPPSFKSVVAS